MEVFDHFDKSGRKEKPITSYSEIKAELENLDEINRLIDDFERNSFFHSRYFIKNAKNQDSALKIKMLNSELREKAEIEERIHGLCHHLGMLRTLLVQKDDGIFKKIRHNFLTNDYSSIPAIASELNIFKDKLSQLESHYKDLINTRHSSIDFKVRHEHHLDEHLKNLNNLHGKQKQLLVSMSLLFSRMIKDIK